MAIDMSTVKAILHNNKNVTKIQDGLGNVLWQKPRPYYYRTKVRFTWTSLSTSKKIYDSNDNEITYFDIYLYSASPITTSIDSTQASILQSSMLNGSDGDYYVKWSTYTRWLVSIDTRLSGLTISNHEISCSGSMWHDFDTTSTTSSQKSLTITGGKYTFSESEIVYGEEGVSSLTFFECNQLYKSSASQLTYNQSKGNFSIVFNGSDTSGNVISSIIHRAAIKTTSAATSFQSLSGNQLIPTNIDMTNYTVTTQYDTSNTITFMTNYGNHYVSYTVTLNQPQ